MPLINYSFIDATGAGITDVVSFAIQDAPVASGTDLILEQIVSSTPASDGTGSIVLAGGNYAVTIAANSESNFTIGVPSTGGPYRIEDLASSVTTTTPSTTYIAKATLTTKGDLISATAASTPARLGVGTNGQVLSADSAETTGLKWVSAGAGDVVGPASATDNALVRFDSTTGKLVQNSTATLDDTGNLSLPAFIQVAGSSAPATPSTGFVRLYALTANGVTRMVQKSEAGFDLVFFRDAVQRVRNNAGVTVTAGTAVYVNGSTGSTPQVTKAKADAIATAGVFGIIKSASILNNAFGTVQFAGIVENLNTSGWTAGDTLYLSAATAGELTNSAPTDPNLQVQVGTVIISHATTGQIFLNIGPSHVAVSSLQLPTIAVTKGGTGATDAATALTNLGAAAASHYHTESIIVACGDETTAITAAATKVSFRMPYAFTVTAVRASLVTAQTSGNIFTVDINEAGTSIISTKLTIDNGELTSTTAVTPAVISDAALADDAMITVDVDQIGDGTAKGLKITLIGHQ